jgi:hypothetical protein
MKEEISAGIQQADGFIHALLIIKEKANPQVGFDEPDPALAILAEEWISRVEMIQKQLQRIRNAKSSYRLSQNW